MCYGAHKKINKIKVKRDGKKGKNPKSPSLLFLLQKSTGAMECYGNIKKRVHENSQTRMDSGGDEGDRTPDLLNAIYNKPILSRLAVSFRTVFR